MRSHAIDVELQTTRAEKLLAGVLSVFLLVGGLWAYDRLDRRDESWETRAPLTAADQQAITRHAIAQEAAFDAATDLRYARQELELARERYRTALDADRDDPGLEAAYRAAERRHAAARTALARAEVEAARARPAADAAQRRRDEQGAARATAAARTTFLLRLGLVAVWLAAAYALLLRARSSRWLPAAGGAVAAGAALVLVLAGDYVEDYVEWSHLGPLALSAGGVVVTLAAFAVLQRTLRRAIPARRLRKGECPGCGYPARGGHCEGCGAALLAPCAACAASRRVGAPHCASCGAP